MSWVSPCSLGLAHYLTSHPAINKDALCFMKAETFNPIMLGFLLYGIMPFNLTVIVVLYVLIHREMRKLFDHSDNFYSQLFVIVFQKQNTQQLKKIEVIPTREVRTTFLLLITVALALITFIPGTAMGYIIIWFPQLLECKALLICFLLLSINSVFNPFIYAFNIRNVKIAARRLLMRMVCCKQDQDKEIALSTGTALDTSH